MDKLKKCPFCKGEAELVKDPLWNGSHGYHDCYGFYITCGNNKCNIKPKTRSYDTIYNKNEETQKQKAADDWNNRG